MSVNELQELLSAPELVSCGRRAGGRLQAPRLEPRCLPSAQRPRARPPPPPPPPPPTSTPRRAGDARAG
jgi:hypothetical protein